jgi:hypothetical protein
MPGTNALAYFVAELVTKKISFIKFTPGHYDGQQQHRSKQLSGHSGRCHAPDCPNRAAPDPSNDHLPGGHGGRPDPVGCLHSSTLRSGRAEAQMPQVRFRSPVQESAGPAQEKISRQEYPGFSSSASVSAGTKWLRSSLMVPARKL